MLEIKVDLPDLGTILTAAPDACRKAMKRAADYQRDAVKTRTMKGVGVNGETLTPSHRSREENGKPLMDNGTMLGSFQVTKISASEAVIGFTSAKEGMKATVHNEGATIKFKKPGWHAIPIVRRTKTVGFFMAKGSVTIPKREFVGISPADAEKIESIMDDAAEEMTK